MIAVNGWVQNTLLITAWVSVALGTTIRFLPFDPPYGFMNGLFLSMGWVAVLAIPQLIDFLEFEWLLLLGIGGVLIHSAHLLSVCDDQILGLTPLGTMKFGMQWL